MDNRQEDFPMISALRKRNMVYLDSAATSQRPRAVLAAERRYITTNNANPRRGISTVSQEANEVLEKTRQVVASFIHASDSREIVFTKNTTEGLNIVAFGYALHHLKRGDEILISELEHHSNLIPWQQIAKTTAATVRWIPVSRVGVIDLQAYQQLLNKQTKIVAIAHISNVFGTVAPIRNMTDAAHRVGAIVVVDGAQAVAHQPVDVSELDADFYAFSGHKMYASSGVGVLYGKYNLLRETEPLLYGGSMIEHVTLSHATWDAPPYRFEGGTSHVSGIVSLGAAINYLHSIGWSTIHKHEQALLSMLYRGLSTSSDVELLMPSDHHNHLGIVSLHYPSIHPHDAGQIYDSAGVMIRVGHHCAEPMIHKLGLLGTPRLSIGMYNTTEDINRAVQAHEQVISRMHRG